MINFAALQTICIFVLNVAVSPEVETSLLLDFLNESPQSSAEDLSSFGRA